MKSEPDEDAGIDMVAAPTSKKMILYDSFKFARTTSKKG